MNITLQLLKNTVKVAKHTKEMECFSASIRNEHRDISIIVSYYPNSNPSCDLYPYWTVNMLEEEMHKVVIFRGCEIREVRNLYNAFINQSADESYLNTVHY